EGNRGLFDGMDVEGSHSTAKLASTLNAPVVLTIDCTKSTRTMAALVKGCVDFDPGVNIAGIILNRVAGIRHQDVVTSSIEKYCGVPVIGAIPKLKTLPFPERHMGLIPPQEHLLYIDAIKEIAKVIENCIDLDAMMSIAESAPDVEFHNEPVRNVAVPRTDSLRIGLIRDSAFQFYYPENIEEIEKHGGRIIETSPLRDSRLPRIDALYIGGGFPETHAKELAENETYRESVLEAARSGMPIYAECGGAIYLGAKLLVQGKEYPMAGVFSAIFSMEKKPQRHGYTILEVQRPNQFLKLGSVFRGHEFHYSRVVDWGGEKPQMAFSVKRGNGMDGKNDGLCFKNVVATYTHIHALGVDGWAESFVDAAAGYRYNQEVKSKTDS
ncbi:MAG: hydrogenobyrinic acid a,c-diamide synthase (glutamine-hydrolyzing), partial [Victivallales bacterium]|nr:hydrogenobyrinic acid a,c-diamide synthase (glutamine-hydrolyzing) [Victivallales bacterium]